MMNKEYQFVHWAKRLEGETSRGRTDKGAKRPVTKSSYRISVG